ncbi:hypothetical protein A2U01_0062928, partial [Trifolium medium]|nr:hypothetical protein [Trifolium medium]
THHKPTTTTAWKVMSVELKPHTEDSSTGLADLTINNDPPRNPSPIWTRVVRRAVVGPRTTGGGSYMMTIRFGCEGK